MKLNSQAFEAFFSALQHPKRMLGYSKFATSHYAAEGKGPQPHFLSWWILHCMQYFSELACGLLASCTSQTALHSGSRMEPGRKKICLLIAAAFFIGRKPTSNSSPDWIAIQDFIKLGIGSFLGLKQPACQLR